MRVPLWQLAGGLSLIGAFVFLAWAFYDPSRWPFWIASFVFALLFLFSLDQLPEYASIVEEQGEPDE